METIKSPTRNKKISTIWAIAKNLGINSEYLHVLVWGMTEVESIKELNPKQLDLVITHLKKEQAKQNKLDKKNESNGKVFQLPTPAQRYKLQITVSDISRILNLRDSKAYLEAISQKMFHKQFEKLNRREYGNLIKQLLLITVKTKKAQ